MAANRQHYYTNPAFCQKSEYYPHDPPQSQRTLSPERQRALSPERVRALSPERRHPPVGAQKPIQIEHSKLRNSRQKSIDNEAEFEEMLVDDSISSKKSTSSEVDFDEDLLNGNRSITFINGNETEIIQTKKGRYAIVKVDDDFCESTSPPQKSRYEYIPMQEQVVRPQRPQPKVDQNRYAAIPTEEEIRKNPVPIRPNQGRYAEIPKQGFEEPKSRYGTIVEERKIPIPASRPNQSNQGRYAEIPPQGLDGPKSRYGTVPVPIHEESFKRLPDRQKHRYEYIPDEDLYQEDRRFTQIKSPQTPRKGNPEATQKLHELLITPEKFTKVPQRVLSPPKRDPFQTPTKSPPKITPRSHPKAQQKLNYAISTRQNIYDKRQATAVIAPICSSPVQSVYSETTFSNKTESWMNLSLQKKPVQATLAVAAIMMILCGGVSSALCFYMVSVVGRTYYLDFGIISGFACLLLGCLGFRGRYCHWLPNRNYISGYIVLSAFSLLTCAGLLVLLFLQPKPGSPLADVTSGAVCGISGLSLILASTGVVASYCCKYPPPDNRVQHAAQGFTV